MQTRFSPPDLSNAVETFVGPYKLALAYRAFSVDQGLTIHVFGRSKGKIRKSCGSTASRTIRTTTSGSPTWTSLGRRSTIRIRSTGRWGNFRSVSPSTWRGRGPEANCRTSGRK